MSDRSLADETIRQNPAQAQAIHAGHEPLISPQVQNRIDLFGAWCSILYILFMYAGWGLVAGFFPPQKPTFSAEQIVAIFQADLTRIRIGMVLVMIAALIAIPFTAILTKALARIEGRAGVLAYSALLGGGGNVVLTFYPAIWWLVAAFRPDRAADLIYLMNDMAWLQFIGGISLVLAMPGAIAAAAFFDRSPHPVFPRWAGFYNLWVMVIILPDQLLFFFHTGPFAWNGLFGLWLPLSAYGSWFIITAFLLRKSILRDRQGLSMPTHGEYAADASEISVSH